MKRSYGYETELLGWPGNSSNGVGAEEYDLDAASCKKQNPWAAAQRSGDELLTGDLREQSTPQQTGEADQSGSQQRQGAWFRCRDPAHCKSGIRTALGSPTDTKVDSPLVRQLRHG